MLEIVLYPIVQKFYYIEYEFARIGKIVVSAAAAFFLIKMFDASVAVKVIVFFGWMLSLFALGFFTKGELSRMKQAFAKIS